jgi:hypothetical protein
MAYRISSSLFLSCTLSPVRGIVRPFSKNMYHFTMSWCEGTKLYWLWKACWVLVTLGKFSCHMTHCACCCEVATMFVSHVLALPRSHVAEPPVNPPITLHGHPTHIQTNCSDMCIFLYTAVYFSNISSGSLCMCKSPQSGKGRLV